MLISDLIAAIEGFAHPSLAEDWDNVGLIIGSSSALLAGPVLLTIDLTERVAEEAVAMRAAAVIAYHPPLFQPVKRLVDGPGSTMPQRVALKLIRAGCAVYSPHTALDAATGGVTDWLADGLADPAGADAVKPGAVLTTGADRRAVRSYARHDAEGEVKIVTFVPADALERVRGALASAGAGLIGEYEVCSFAAPGTGTFKGSERSRPAVGSPGALESVEEVRLEMVCSRRALALALMTLREFHPYEEPAVDVYPLEPKPDRRVGVGRRLTLDHPVPLTEVGERLKRRIGVGAVQIAAVGGQLQQPVSRVVVVPGAGASVVPMAIAEGAEVFVTGEMKHHEVNAALASGLSVILGGHTATERGYLPRLAAVLAERLPRVKFFVSKEDRDPLVLR